MKQGIEKALDIAEMKLNTASAEGFGPPKMDKFERVMVLDIIRSAIETAFKEVIPKNQFSIGSDFAAGHDYAIDHIREKMNRYLGK